MLALELAGLVDLLGGQPRGSDRVEQIAVEIHLGACSIALDYGASEDEAIGALLHDAIEDVEPSAAARAVVADLRRSGNAVFARFSLTRDETLAYHRSLVVVFRANPAHAPDLVDELDRVVTEMERLAKESGDG